MKSSELNKEQIEIRDEVQGYLKRKAKVEEYTELYPDTDERSRELNILARTSIEYFENYAGVLLTEEPTIVELKEAQIEINKTLRNIDTSNEGGKTEKKGLITIREILGEKIRKQSKTNVSSLINDFYSKLDTRTSTKEERDYLMEQIARVKLLKEAIDPRGGGSDPRMLEARLVLFFDNDLDHQEALADGTVDLICKVNKVSQAQIISKLSSDKAAIGHAIAESQNSKGAKIYDLTESQNISSVAKKLKCRVGDSSEFMSFEFAKKSKIINAIAEHVTQNLFGEDYAKSINRVNDSEVIKIMITEALRGVDLKILEESQDKVKNVLTEKAIQLTEPIKAKTILSYIWQKIWQENKGVQLKRFGPGEESEAVKEFKSAVAGTEKEEIEVGKKAAAEKEASVTVGAKAGKFFKGVVGGFSSPSRTPSASKTIKTGRTIRESISKF